MNMTFAFISRHEPTNEQHVIANAAGVDLVHIGDLDAFTVTPEQVGAFEGVVVVHPAAALRLAPVYVVGVFENGNRAPVGEPPQFKPVALHLYGGQVRSA